MPKEGKQRIGKVPLQEIEKYFSTWINFGDANPREEGGIFIKYDSKREEFNIVHTRDMKSYFSKREYQDMRKRGMGRYQIEEVEVPLDEVENERVMHFVGTGGVETIGDVGNILSGWIPYYGGSFKQTTDNYWKTLEEFGIYPNHK